MTDENNENSKNPQSDPDTPQTESETESEKAIAKAFMVSMSWAMAGLSDKSKSEAGDRESKD
ncbi:hypothetical protein [Lyngbya sp. CCY1209]|jgi:hypothetical protein|uniref:hypothetical protein n=1 Tax=Lyngbya sp. CCY1209 TaxID=2886103 RepID=UPI002D2151A0|nr:hypothetical protein [Lyngbya sp. CCY1209]MEB3883090.1 hypothetical protein [Lyngbya sp. CCY1209]